MKKVKAMGQTVSVRNVINRGTQPCVGCECETGTCAKLYKRAGSNATMCVEM